MMKRLIILVSFIVLFSAGCSNPNDASESNFKDALNKYFASRPLCEMISGSIFSDNSIPTYYFDFPTVIPTGSPYPNGQKTRERASRLFSVLAEFELLTATTGKFDWEDGFRRVHNLEAIRFSLSEKGRSLFQGDKLCYGKRVVDSIVNITLHEEMGQRSAHVKYTYKDDIDQAWIKHSHFDDLYQGLESSGEAGVNFVLLHEGWVHMSEFINQITG